MTQCVGPSPRLLVDIVCVVIVLGHSACQLALDTVLNKGLWKQCSHTALGTSVSPHAKVAPALHARSLHTLEL